jgi:hypothetical protein
VGQKQLDTGKIGGHVKTPVSDRIVVKLVPWIGLKMFFDRFHKRFPKLLELLFADPVDRREFLR